MPHDMYVFDRCECQPSIQLVRKLPEDIHDSRAKCMVWGLFLYDQCKMLTTILIVTKTENCMQSKGWNACFKICHFVLTRLREKITQRWSIGSSLSFKMCALLRTSTSLGCPATGTFIALTLALESPQFAIEFSGSLTPFVCIQNRLKRSCIPCFPLKKIPVAIAIDQAFCFFFSFSFDHLSLSNNHIAEQTSVCVFWLDKTQRGPSRTTQKDLCCGKNRRTVQKRSLFKPNFLEWWPSDQKKKMFWNAYLLAHCTTDIGQPVSKWVSTVHLWHPLGPCKVKIPKVIRQFGGEEEKLLTQVWRRTDIVAMPYNPFGYVSGPHVFSTNHRIWVNNQW